jgi:hypothetical protein
MLPSAAATGIRVPSAGDLLLARQGGSDHRRRTPHPTVHADGPSRTVNLAGAAFHARFRSDKLRHPAIGSENGVGADHGAHATAIAQL